MTALDSELWSVFDARRVKAPELRGLVTRFVNAGLNQYPPMAGVAPLRDAIAEKVETLYGAKYDPETEVTVTPGATYAIFTAIAAMVRPGDEVILIEPAYDSYAPSVEVNGGKPVYVQLTYPDYAIDWDAVGRLDDPSGDADDVAVLGYSQTRDPVSSSRSSRV